MQSVSVTDKSTVTTVSVTKGRMIRNVTNFNERRWLTARPKNQVFKDFCAHFNTLSLNYKTHKHTPINSHNHFRGKHKHAFSRSHSRIFTTNAFFRSDKSRAQLCGNLSAETPNKEAAVGVSFCGTELWPANTSNNTHISHTLCPLKENWLPYIHIQYCY